MESRLHLTVTRREIKWGRTVGGVLAAPTNAREKPGPGIGREIPEKVAGPLVAPREEPSKVTLQLACMPRRQQLETNVVISCECIIICCGKFVNHIT
jgi:hypothetical protein